VTRTCTVCTHPERQNIDKALVAMSSPYREIALRYGLGSQMAVMRHKADHLLPSIVAAWQRERADNGAELASELRGWMDTVGLLFAACRDWLADPDDPTRFTLEPRTTEVVIHTEERTEPGRPPLRRKMKLSQAIAIVDGEPGIGDVTLYEAKIADPRKLILDTSKTLEAHLRLLGELVGKLATAGTTTFLVSPEWLDIQREMQAALAPFPEARIALAAALSGGAIEGEYHEVR
jgi:hypothetical protein